MGPSYPPAPPWSRARTTQEGPPGSSTSGPRPLAVRRGDRLSLCSGKEAPPTAPGEDQTAPGTGTRPEAPPIMLPPTPASRAYSASSLAPAGEWRPLEAFGLTRVIQYRRRSSTQETLSAQDSPVSLLHALKMALLFRCRAWVGTPGLLTSSL